MINSNVKSILENSEIRDFVTIDDGNNEIRTSFMTIKLRENECRGIVKLSIDGNALNGSVFF